MPKLVSTIRPITAIVFCHIPTTIEQILQGFQFDLSLAEVGLLGLDLGQLADIFRHLTRVSSTSCCPSIVLGYSYGNTIVHACDMSRLDFCSATLMGFRYYSDRPDSLQSILNAATHIRPHWRRNLPRGTTRAVPLSKVGWLK